MRAICKSYIGGREENQDFIQSVLTDYGPLYIVCDGMGGASGGSIASETAAKTIIEYFNGKSYNVSESVKDLLRDSIVKANEVIYKKSIDNPGLKGMGTTVVAVLITENSAVVAYVGDSRVYQLRGRKKIFRTFDHSYVFQKVSAGIITEEQARLSNESNIILRALGVDINVEVDIEELSYCKDDRFILCSDGFWGSLPEDELISKMSSDSKRTLEEIVDLITEEIDSLGKENGGNHDNFSVIAFDVENDSKIVLKMTKRIKAALIILLLCLVASLSFNVYLVCKFMKFSTEHDRLFLQQSNYSSLDICNDTINANVDTCSVNIDGEKNEK